MTQPFDTIERAFDNIQGIGRIWANYGVNVGKVALETGAERLKATAAFLEGLSNRMNDMVKPEEPVAEVTPEAPQQQP